MKDRAVQLKVCEGCGALFLRADGDRPYCAGCQKRLAGFVQRRKRGWRVKGQRYGLVAMLPSVCAVGAEVAPSMPEPIEWRLREVGAETLRQKRRRRQWENVAFYRKYTEAMLRRYLQLSMEAGRSPSLLGRELFRGNVTHCRMRDFTDSIAFCVDVERLCLQLDREERDVISRIALQQYTQGETAGMLGISLRQTVRRYAAAMDKLSGKLLDCGLLEPMGMVA